jgi:hypothetical protein
VRAGTAVLAAALASCAHGAATDQAKKANKTGVEVEDAIHGVRFQLPPGADLWQVSREGAARSLSGIEAEVSTFAMAKSAQATQCRDHARSKLGSRKESREPATAVDAPREESTSDSPTALWTFTTGASSAPVRNRWAFFARGADCVVLHVSGPKGESFGDQTFEVATKSFQVLPLPSERQREADLLAGMGFLERRDPGSALERFEALTRREPDNAKAHFGALMAGFEIGPQAYARALPHGSVALKSERELTPEQRQLALRAVGVMQLAENQIRAAADTLAELVVRQPELAEGQYNYACALARLGDQQGALDHLRAALRLDGELAAHARADDDLKSLRGTPAFDQIVSAPSSSK